MWNVEVKLSNTNLSPHKPCGQPGQLKSTSDSDQTAIAIMRNTDLCIISVEKPRPLFFLRNYLLHLNWHLKQINHFEFHYKVGIAIDYEVYVMEILIHKSSKLQRQCSNHEQCSHTTIMDIYLLYSCRGTGYSFLSKHIMFHAIWIFFNQISGRQICINLI